MKLNLFSQLLHTAKTTCKIPLLAIFSHFQPEILPNWRAERVLHVNIKTNINYQYQTKTLSRTFGCCCGCPNLEGHCKHLLRVAKPHHWHAFVQVVFEYSLQVRILCFPNTNNKKRRQWGAVLSVQPSMQAESKQAHQYIDLIHGKTTHWSSSLAELEAFKKECVCQPAGR